MARDCLFLLIIGFFSKAALAILTTGSYSEHSKVDRRPSNPNEAYRKIVPRVLYEMKSDRFLSDIKRARANINVASKAELEKIEAQAKQLIGIYENLEKRIQRIKKETYLSLSLSEKEDLRAVLIEIKGRIELAQSIINKAHRKLNDLRFDSSDETKDTKMDTKPPKLFDESIVPSYQPPQPRSQPVIEPE